MVSNNQSLTPAIRTLIEGYKQFHLEHYQQAKKFELLIKNGQSPKVIMIACCDSRVDPAILMNPKAGEIFMVRNVANLVPPYEQDNHYHGTSAALEFAVLSMKVTDVIVIGHSDCGGIRALMERNESDSHSDFIGTWMNIATQAKQKVLEAAADEPFDKQLQRCEKKSVQISLKNLMTFPWIQQRVADGELALHGWYFDIGSGLIKAYQPDSDEFIQLDRLS